VVQGGSDSLSAAAGSLVEVTGVCVMNIAEDGKLLSLQVLMRSPEDLRVLKRPTWWTTRRLLGGIASLLVILMLSVSWTVISSRRNAALKVLVREKDQAKTELQKVNDRLEERVRQRSEELRVEVRARQDAEVQFEAVLKERTRLAQELHDTLEQTLTGIALQMDTAAKFAGTNAARADHHNQLARKLVTQSQNELRCSVWDLRSAASGQVDLARLLDTIARQLTEETGIEVRVSATGRVRQLPETLEENVLRIAQEALTNVIKHSRATKAEITLDFGDTELALSVTDNGCGFVPERRPGPMDGHFGLLGVSERTTRLQGKLSLTSEPGKGSTLRVTIPLTAAAAPATPVGGTNT